MFEKQKMKPHPLCTNPIKFLDTVGKLLPVTERYTILKLVELGVRKMLQMIIQGMMVDRLQTKKFLRTSQESY